MATLLVAFYINYGLFAPPQTKRRRFAAHLPAGDFLLLSVPHDRFEPSLDFTKFAKLMRETIHCPYRILKVVCAQNLIIRIPNQLEHEQSLPKASVVKRGVVHVVALLSETDLVTVSLRPLREVGFVLVASASL